MNNLEGYLKEILEEEVKIVPENEEEISKLPYYLNNLYKFWKGCFFKRPVILAEYKGKELLTPDQFKKQMDNIKELLGIPAILVLGGMESYNRNRLIQKKVDFILENKQMYLPDFLIDLKDYLKPQPARKEHLTPAAQYLLLFHLQKETLDGATYRQISTKVPYEYLTVSRAVENLTAFGLCFMEGRKEKIMRFQGNRKELWVRALPYLFNPVKKSIYINDPLPKNLSKLTGINALAHYTNISGAPADQYAINDRSFKKLQREGVVPMYSDYDGNYQVELWKYEPIVIGSEEYVDRLSLFLVYRLTENERIKVELENMITNFLW